MMTLGSLLTRKLLNQKADSASGIHIQYTLKGGGYFLKEYCFESYI